MLAFDDRYRNKLKFQIIGDGSMSARVDEVIKELPEGFIERKHVEYTEMPQVYIESDIVLAPSKPTKTWDEQYCTVLLEAQAMGLQS